MMKSPPGHHRGINFRLLVEHGLEEVSVLCTHGFFFGGAGASGSGSEIKEIVTTDTVPQKVNPNPSWSSFHRPHFRGGDPAKLLSPLDWRTFDFGDRTQLDEL